MLKLWKLPATHEDLFIERYERLLGWSQQLAGGDLQRAEDVVHDTFVQFVLRRPPLNSIENLDAYLYVMLKNTHLSQARRASQDPNRNLSLVEYDSAEIGLRSADPYIQVQVREELRRICEYATVRKQTSKAGSVLILRFFHGYYPSEIAEVLRTTRPAVDKWLQLARAEARLYLADSSSLTFMSESRPPAWTQIDFGYSPVDPLKELKEAILRSRRGECPPAEGLRHMYSAKETGAVECDRLAHIVSCAHCLNSINQLLGIPLLSQRSPSDTLGPKSPPRNGPPGSPPGSASGEHGPTKCLRRVKETIEHKPKELRVAANGYFLASHRIRSELSEQNLVLNVGEPVSFIEVFSEQGIRLILFEVEPPPEGVFDQTGLVKFDDGRSLETKVSFTNPWPTLRLVYTDPTFNEAESLDIAAVERDASHLASQAARADGDSQCKTTPLLARSFSKWQVLGRLWLRPAVVTLLLAVIACAAFWLMQSSMRAPSAEDLLTRSIGAEESIAAAPDKVVHRTLRLEERRVDQESSLAGGDVIARRRVELWQSAGKGIKARRLYDEKNNLLAGEWTNAAGSSVVYHHGSKPRPDSSDSIAISFDSIWRLEPSAKQFRKLAQDVALARVRESSPSYIIEFASDVPYSSSRILRASIALDRSTLHANEQTLLIEQDGERREYRIVEVGFEHQAANSVPPNVFEPDPELVSSLAPDARAPQPEMAALSAASEPTSSAIVTPDLEVETLRLLSSVGADLGEQINVKRTAEGKLLIEGVVETRKRKEEILQALQPVILSQALKLDVRTVEEATIATPPREFRSRAVQVEREEAVGNKIPVDSDIRRFLSGRGVGPSQLADEVQSFAGQTVGQSNRMMRHAWALKSLADRFSPDDLRDFDAGAKAKWLALIRAHTIGLSRESSILRHRLAPVFPTGNSSASIVASSITDDNDLIRVVRELFGLCSAIDGVVRAAFSVSADPAKAIDIRNPQFGRDLNSVEALAEKIVRRQ